MWAYHGVCDQVGRCRWHQARFHATLSAGCRRDPNGQSELIEPPNEASLASSPRLKDFIALSNPRLIVAVGWHAQWAIVNRTCAANDLTVPIAAMPHPATVLYAHPDSGLKSRRLVYAICEIYRASLYQKRATRFIIAESSKSKPNHPIQKMVGRVSFRMGIALVELGAWLCETQRPAHGFRERHAAIEFVEIATQQSGILAR